MWRAAARDRRRSFPILERPAMADRAGKLLWAASLTIALYPILALLRLPERYTALTSESGVGELAQATMFGGAAILLWLEVRSCRRAGSSWIPLSILAAGLSFVALEEISWGQRLLGFSVPALQSVNLQAETNFHNMTLWIHPFQQIVVPFITFIYGISVPLGLPGARWIARLFRRFNLPIAPPQARPLFLLATLAFAPSRIFAHVELGELMLASAMLVTAGVSTQSGSAGKALRSIGVCVGSAMLIFNFGPHLGFERTDTLRRLTIAEQFYIPLGMTRNAERLLEEEVGRHNGVLSVGSAVQALSHLGEWRREERGAKAPSPEFLTWASRRGQLDLAGDHVSLAILRQLAGRGTEAEEQLRLADEILAGMSLPGGELTSFTELQALIRLRACQGRTAEAIELLERDLLNSFPRERAVMRARVERLASLFGGFGLPG